MMIHIYVLIYIYYCFAYICRLQRYRQYLEKRSLADASDDIEGLTRRSSRIRSLILTPPLDDNVSEKDSDTEDNCGKLIRYGPGVDLKAHAAIETYDSADEADHTSPPPKKKIKMSRNIRIMETN